ncbi:Eco29kI family restriction endonuclease [Microvirga calopogonii]|uniref:Eco29kI family restriction endonuclease n=1 Tax=Microvirga calopogonii TaxID=2078013 RepID=UPI000E0D0D63|nr:Eco29kI family restriction endonuclease [Microvirga calopogonii]
MARKPKTPSRQVSLVEDIRSAIHEIEALGPSLSKVAAKRTRELLGEVKHDVGRAVASLDPVKEPTSWFDPADQNTAGRLVAAALLAQPRVPLDLVPRTYGAGVYAIYYIGDHPTYAPIAGTETPIYVGKADPASHSAMTPREQGQKLYGRLADHRKMIRTVEGYAVEKGLPNPLHIADFECRRLVTATNAQMYAERHLISLFQPVWNSDTKICWGISKHGDTEGRSNDRSPWDVLHPGRKWAMAEKLKDSRSVEQILDDLKSHFAENTPFKDRDHVIELFLEAFAQDPMTATAPVTDDEVAPEDIVDEDAPPT